jgi:hypothetical protein
MVVEQLSGTAWMCEDNKLEESQEKCRAQLERDYGCPHVAFIALPLGKTFDRFMHQLQGEEFTLHQIARICNASHGLVYSWLHHGIIRASLAGPRGSGRGREVLFSRWDSYVAASVAALHRAGCARRTLVHVASNLDRLGERYVGANGYDQEDA